jgi:hypothetical protein
MHKLAIVAVIGLSASAVCMGAAAAIGGNEFGKGLDGLDLPIFSDLPRCENGGGYPINRTLDWDGSDHAGIAIPGRVTYAPGNDDKLHVSGNPVLVPHIRVRDGRVELDCRNWHDSRNDLEITLPGREFKKFSVSGSGSLTLQNLDQMMVKISVSGSGSVKAGGKVEHADIHVSGSGDADLSQLKTNIASVHISGSGSSDIAPSDEADIRVSGSGDVNLHSNPKRLETHISGSGRIHNITG